MNLKQVFAAALAVVSIVGIVMQPVYGATADISIGKPPPALLVEPEPQHRTGYVWIPGYWRWNGISHVWVKGHVVAARRGYHYVPEHWVETNGRWVFYPGRWVQ
jgi:WXXGXW repeat (2 copies)